MMTLDDFKRPGRLHIRTLLFPLTGRYEATLAYFTGQDTQYMSLAGIAKGKARAEYGYYLECVETTDEATGSNNLLRLTYATDDDIRAFVLAWADSMPLSEWLADLSKWDGLDPAELERVRRIVEAR